MPVPSSINDLSTTASLNFPVGSEQVFPQLDNYLRFYASCIAIVRDGKANRAGDTFTGAVQVPGYVSVTQTSGQQRLLMGNQDGSGTNKPAIIAASNGNISIGYGTSWTGNGGTFVTCMEITSTTGIATFQVPPRALAAASAPTDLVRKQEMDAALDVSGFIGQISPGGRLTAPTGWLLIDGKTIGSAASGATARANADTLALYTFLWDFSAAAVPIFTSTGAASTRGASAASDFAADKRLALFTANGAAFLRMWSPTQTIDSGRVAGTVAADKLKAHGHRIYGDNTGSGANGGVSSPLISPVGGSSRAGGYLLNNTAVELPIIEPTGDAETAPYSLAMPHYIRYR